MHAADANDTIASGEPADDVDRAIVAGQIGRTPRALRSVAVRCVHGFPAVTRQEPTDTSGRPFPTAYYLTCPHLVRQIDRIESDGGVKRFEAWLASDERLKQATEAAHQRHAAIDGRGSMIAATGDSARVKCLHAHAAFALADGDHALGDEVLREASPRWCEDARCASMAGDPPAASNRDM